MNITIKIDGFCASGGHIHMTVTKDGTVSKQITIHKSDFQIVKDEWEDGLIILIRNFIKESGLTNWTQIKTELEKKVFKL